ncbi:MAG: DNA methyltransferase [Candidatus Brocadiaceae bacterium]|jgi:DNA modification methylase
MEVELLSIEEVKPYENNPCQNEEAVEAVANSIREFGFRQPIVVDEDGVIVAGHTRFKAAQKLGLEKVPVHVAEGLTPEQVRAYRLADNAARDLSEWDYELLPIELGELQDAGFELDLIGFPEDELAGLMDTGELKEGLTDPDAVPEPPDEATTQPGDLWILGDHRLLCGDAGKAEDVDRLLDGETIQLVNTDPPYGVNVEPRSGNATVAGRSSFLPTERSHSGLMKRHPELRQSQGSADTLNREKQARMHHQAFDEARLGKRHATTEKMRPKDRPLEGDFVSDEDFAELLRAWFGQIARVLEPGRAFYIWGGYSNIGNMPPAMADCGLYFSQAIIWVKEHPVLTRKDYMGNHEWCFYGWREGAGHKCFGPNNAADVWGVKKVSPQKMVHLTEKPVELAVRAIQYSSRPGENVLDLFGGSGSTLIACEQTGRYCNIMEIDALYCDVIVQRWEQFTGQKAERASRAEDGNVSD